jgi:hypothetical protein
MGADELVDAGAGTAMGIVWLGVIPGFLPAVVLTVMLVLPLVAVGLAAALVVAPPYPAWRLARRGGRARSQESGSGLRSRRIATRHAP